MSNYFLTVKDVATRYKISRANVYNFVKDGRLPAGVHFGKTHRWSLAQLEEFEKAKNAKE